MSQNKNDENKNKKSNKNDLKKNNSKGEIVENLSQYFSSVLPSDNMNVNRGESNQKIKLPNSKNLTKNNTVKISTAPKPSSILPSTQPPPPPPPEWVNAHYSQPGPSSLKIPSSSSYINNNTIYFQASNYQPQPFYVAEQFLHTNFQPYNNFINNAYQFPVQLDGGFPEFQRSNFVYSNSAYDALFPSLNQLESTPNLEKRTETHQITEVFPQACASPPCILIPAPHPQSAPVVNNSKKPENKNRKIKAKNNNQETEKRPGKVLLRNTQQEAQGRAEASLSRFSGVGLLARYKPQIIDLTDYWNQFQARWFARFEKNYLDKKKSIENVVSDFRKDDFNLLYTLITKYFDYLESSLTNDSGHNFYFEYQERVFDFYSTGERFHELINLPKFIDRKIRRNFKELLKRYDEILSDNIKAVRKNLMQVRANILRDTLRKDFQNFAFREKNESNSPFWWRKDYALVVDSVGVVLEPQVFSYSLKKACDIEKAIKNCRAVEDKLQCAINEIGLSSKSHSNLKSIVDCLQKIIQKSELKQFKPELFLFGSIASGLGTYDSDIDLYIKFTEVDDIVAEDFFTAILLLNNLLLILYRDLGVAEFGDCLIFSQRCPIVKLPFNKCFPNLQRRFKDIKEFDRRLNKYKPRNKNERKKNDQKHLEKQAHSSETIAETEISDAENSENMENKGHHEDILKKVIGTSFNTCDISLKNMFGVYNSRFIKFLTEYDRRFYEVCLLIKFWAKEQNLVGRRRITSYGLTMLVIFFLQNQNPPVLPPVEKFLQLAKDQGKEEIILQGYHFEFCDDIDMIGRSQNTMSTIELLCEFFRFYHDFDFYHQAICVRVGKPVTRMELYEAKKSQDLSSFTFDTFICIEDPFVVQHNCGRPFKSSQIFHWYTLIDIMKKEITPDNCIELLVRPIKYTKNFGNYIHLPIALMFNRLDFNEKVPKLVPVDEVKAIDFEEQICYINKLLIQIIQVIFTEHFGLTGKYKNLYSITTHENMISVSIDFEYIIFLFKEAECRHLAHKCNRNQNHIKKTTAEDFKEPVIILKKLAKILKNSKISKLNHSELGKNFGEVFRITWFKSAQNDIPIFITGPIVLVQSKQNIDKINKFAQLLHFFINETFYRMDYFHNDAGNEFLSDLFQDLSQSTC